MNELDKTSAQQPQVIVPLVDLVQGYIEAGDRIKQFDEEYDKNVIPLKEAREHLKSEIIKVFKERKEFMTRIVGGTMSLSVRRTAKIFNEVALVAHLKEIGLAKDYVAERVTDLFKDSALEELARQAIQDDNTVDASKLPPGVAFQETETITPHKNKKKDPRKALEGSFTELPPKINN